ncbi:hypothetical protein C1H46_021891 [Malus baccata]|uniref:Uncharacterized protein n=1 Tax=Malus baccata TaxID=106549 RepID=A0A540M1C6_MALBA|nr:hypothetical protein C1H46_021891 [Malus baccata]
MQQDPPHCAAPPVAAAVAQQGLHVHQAHTLRCSRWTRRSLRGDQPHQIRGARVVLEPPRLQKAPCASRGGVRLLEQRPARDPLRRVAVRGGSPIHFPLRVG